MRIFYLGLALLLSGEFSSALQQGIAQLQETQKLALADVSSTDQTATGEETSAVSAFLRRKTWWSRTPTPTPKPTVLATASATTLPASTGTPQPTAVGATNTPSATPVVIKAPNKMMWGADLGDWQPSAITTFETLVGKQMSIYATFVHWGNEKEFPMLYTSSVRDAGKTMLIFWEATDYNNSSVNQPQFNYDSINAGSWDSYFTQFAKDAATYNGPVILIPFSEMNDNSTPWGGQVNGNTPQKFITAYQRIRGFFKNATNVKFGWSPNNVSSPQTAQNDLDAYYPGDAYVDYVGVDGFNFGNPWQTWSQVFDKALTQLSKHNKPMLISSTASAAGSNKATWISDGFGTQIKNYPLVQGWVWFNENKEANWLINSDATSLAAFKSVLP